MELWSPWPDAHVLQPHLQGKSLCVHTHTHTHAGYPHTYTHCVHAHAHTGPCMGLLPGALRPALFQVLSLPHRPCKAVGSPSPLPIRTWTHSCPGTQRGPPLTQAGQQPAQRSTVAPALGAEVDGCSSVTGGTGDTPVFVGLRLPPGAEGKRGVGWGVSFLDSKKLRDRMVGGRGREPGPMTMPESQLSPSWASPASLPASVTAAGGG